MTATAVSQTISLLQNCKTPSQLHQLHSHVIKSNLTNHTPTIIKLISLYSHHGSLHHALSLLHHFPHPILIPHIDFLLPALLKACGKSRAFEQGSQLHGLIVKSRMLLDPYVANALIRMYSELGCVEFGRRVFDTVPQRDQFSWNSMLSGYFKAGEIELAREVFYETPERDLVCCNAMIDGLFKSGRCEAAEEVFAAMQVKDVVTWTSMVSGNVVNGRPKEALRLFREMLSQGVRPDAPALVSVLSAVADLGFVEEGKWVHGYICMNKIRLSSGFIGSALLDMYAKCGHIGNAYNVFEEICRYRNIGDWNCMISGLALYGLGHEALDIFLDMKMKAIEPDEITFLGLLTACNHGGLVDEGRYCFELMQDKYRLVPKIQHYGCIVDLFGRAGHLEEAANVILSMPLKADAIVWKAILNACTIHGNVAMGESAARKAIDLAPDDSSCYILLSNLYAKVGRWDDVGKVRFMMKRRGVRKVPGSSSILVNGKLHEFVASKKLNVNCSADVHTKLMEVVSRLKLEGYKPDLSQVLLDIEVESKENSLILHSEKMALAFGLINASKGSPIHIVKNLRICCDCHSFIKLVSAVYCCRIVVRDQNRFHQFENGSCSCKDFW